MNSAPKSDASNTCRISISASPSSGFGQRLTHSIAVLPHLGEEFLARHHARLGVLVGLEKDHESHVALPSFFPIDRERRARQWGRETASGRELGRSGGRRAPFVEAPSAPAATGDEKEQNGIQERQLPLVHGRKEFRIDGELPVKLDVGDRHRPAREEGRPAVKAPAAIATPVASSIIPPNHTCDPTGGWTFVRTPKIF